MTDNEHPMEMVHPESDIIRPRSGPRSGALRMVRIEPPVLESPPILGDGVAVQGMLPLEGLTGPSGRSSASPRTRRAVPEFSDTDLRAITQQFCVGVSEVIYGERPANQLLRCTSERVYSDLAKRSAMAQSRRRMTQERAARTRLERIRFQRPSPKALEICARLSQGPRSHALAARLELVNGRWICVALEARTP